MIFFFFFKQKTAYEMRISDWSSDVCSSDLIDGQRGGKPHEAAEGHRIKAHQPPGVGAFQRVEIIDQLLGRGRVRRVLRHDHVQDEDDGQRNAGQAQHRVPARTPTRSEEHTSELQSLMRISYAVFCLKKKKRNTN